MVKIWVKILSDEKIIKSKTIDVDEKNTSFFDMLKTACNALNVPTPVLLDKHVYDFNLFNQSVFKPADFVETVIFDKLVLEHIYE